MPATLKPTSLLRIFWLLDVVGSALCFCWWLLAVLQAGGNGSGATDPAALKARSFLVLFLLAHFVLSIALAARMVTNRRAMGLPGKGIAMLSAGLILLGLMLMNPIIVLVCFFLRVSV